MRYFPALAFLFLIATSSPTLSQPGYVSPLTGSLSTHDPVVIKQDSLYYLFHTGNGVPIKTSRDRIQWDNGLPASVYSTAPAWHARFRNTIDSWAPAISYWDGKYWLYYSLSTFGTRQSAIGLRTNTTLHPSDSGYQWVDQGVVVCTYNNGVTHSDCFNAGTTGVNTADTTAFNGIDPDIILDSAGTPWLSWGSFGAGIQLIRLNRASGKPDSGAQPSTIAHRYTTASASGAAYERSIEAPVISHHGGWYYLWYSYDRCCASTNSTYRVMVTRSRSVTGPYVDKAGNLAHPPYRAGGTTTGSWQTANAGTLVSEGDQTNWFATGHNDILVDNDTTFLVNHGYIRPGGQTRLMIRPLYWDAEGWPTLDSTLGLIMPPVSLSMNDDHRSMSQRRAPLRPPSRALVPWKGEMRDLRGRVSPP
jgi:arabinan endo-1,5-alpha-L-arabinosidase